MSDIDPDAVEINKLFCKAHEALGGTVTGTQHFSEEISASRNEPQEPLPPAHRCARCATPFILSGETFVIRQTRYPILDYRCFWYGEKLQSKHIVVSLCRDCFDAKVRHMNDMYAKWGRYDRFGSIAHWGSELGTKAEGDLAPRYDTECRGCGEPIHTVANARDRHWRFCSHACYQRDYRKRRRGHDSVVQWKIGPDAKCVVCKKRFEQYGKPGKRKDAQYCSGRCRQWAYRRRKVMP